MPENNPFDITDARRLVEHPDTPAAYAEWRELIPLMGSSDRTHVGNLLGWSFSTASEPLGASRPVFEQAFENVHESNLDSWMFALSSTPAEDFLDHHVPFLRNIAAFTETHDVDRLIEKFLEQYRDPQIRGVAAERLYRPHPEIVHIEITRSCNFACGMCSSRTGGFRRDRTMPLEVFGEVVRVLGENARRMRLNGYGETSIVPELDRYLDCLDEFEFDGIREIITNLSAPADVYEDLVERGFVLMASWDSTDADRFEKLRAGSDFDSMLQTLKRVGSMLEAERERLLLLSTIQEENVAEIEHLVTFAAEVGAGGVIFNMVNEEGPSTWMAQRFDELTRRFARSLELAEEHDLHVSVPDHIDGQRTGLRGAKRSSATFCDRPWTEIVVRYDTELTVCNMFNPFSYGVLSPPGPPQDVPIRLNRLWNGPNAALFREVINTDAPHPYCEDCYFLHGSGAGS